MTYGKLPPLNPDDLKLPPPPPSAADKVRSEDAISISEVWEELKAKTKEMCVSLLLAVNTCVCVYCELTTCALVCVCNSTVGSWDRQCRA